MEGFVVRRLVGNVRVFEVFRRGLATAPRLLPGALLPVGLLLLPGLALPFVLEGALPAELRALLLPVVLSNYAVAVAPLAALLLVAPAVRGAAGSRLQLSDVAFGGFAKLKGGFVLATLAGFLCAVGFFACWLPGLFVGALLFAAGPVAALEPGTTSERLVRVRNLARGHVLPLAGVVFLIGFVEGILFRIFGSWLVLSDPVDLAVLAAPILCFSTLLRACAAAVAYEDMLIASGEAEIGDLAQLLGGVQRDVDVLALSERSIDALAKRRSIVGSMTGSSSPPKEADAMASVRDMEAVASRKRHAIKLALVTVVGLVLVGSATAVGVGVSARLAEAKRLDTFEATVREAHAAYPAGDMPIDEIDQLGREIASFVRGARPGTRRATLGRLLAVHADAFYGHGFANAFALWGNGAASDQIVDALRIPLDAAGCAGAIAEAKAHKKNRARAFAKHCPAGEAAPLDYRRFRPNTALSNATLGELLELRARERRIEDHQLHQTAIQLLLPE
jgi:hypothetical protein